MTPEELKEAEDIAKKCLAYTEGNTYEENTLAKAVLWLSDQYIAVKYSHKYLTREYNNAADLLSKIKKELEDWSKK